jgi:hypothetical protein
MLRALCMIVIPGVGRRKPSPGAKLSRKGFGYVCMGMGPHGPYIWASMPACEHVPRPKIEEDPGSARGPASYQNEQRGSGGA